MKKFKFPEQSPHKPPKSSTNIDKLLDVSLKTLAVQNEEPRTTTEKRNWADLVAKWDEQGTFAKNKNATVVADLGSSKTYKRHFCLNTCPTVTRSRALQRGFWVVKKDNAGQFTKRKLTAEDYLAVQGWPKRQRHRITGLLDGAKLRAATGNGFSFNVAESLLRKIVPLLAEQKIGEMSTSCGAMTFDA